MKSIVKKLLYLIFNFNFVVLGFFLFFLFSHAQAHIYRCENLETGEVFFSNQKLNASYCQLYIKEKPKNLNPKSLGAKFPYSDNYAKLPGEYENWFEKVAQDFSLDPALLKAIAKVESSFNPRAISPKGAMGIMQLMPQTARLVGVEDPYHPLENLKGGAKYLRMLIDEFRELTLALAAYNAGPEKVKLYRGIPPYPETQSYVKNVLYYYSIFKSKKPNN
ncbi:lytic transglycosylase domain-containing protein [Thermodesulfobacterium hveragerdense]|uniref:lytic transglycosylase domain-containing protein n=1 Tax=Thermodesulfobacterium hveragerdense TaxID=53424 RepID=UPI000422EA4E|nr:lytic transglycosylase domain-containing protein [Thermodesulfobacterium hveragerdense]